MRLTRHLDIIKIDKNGVHQPDYQCRREQFLRIAAGVVSLPLHRQLIGVHEERDHRNKAKHHELERHSSTEEKRTHQNQCDHITDNRFRRAETREKGQFGLFQFTLQQGFLQSFLILKDTHNDGHRNHIEKYGRKKEKRFGVYYWHISILLGMQK